MGVSAIAPVTGDVNGDGVVDATDLGIIDANIGKTIAGGYGVGDLNDDGVVNQDDFTIFQLGVAEYDASHPDALVPEPGVMTLAGIPLLALVRRRRAAK
jgi:hypothetical protein